ncbi:GOLPH3/VPS74 family protein [Cellulomonas triticagri]|uniref:GPP34 family phosphoprotein n=1 Tax=Cellulomonas triticagri TaxID=2483352 RepID=A0A3M2J5P7_9CELL|nr:GPP34 family phosphoprotein [Cellulomonas triticagri]RMI08729.1 GPP34 family phosphoprotein [Cellulomonas triticagri]
MTTLIAEDLLLLLLDDEKGTPTSSSLDTALGGALLLELALAGAVHVRERTSVWSSAKVVVDPGASVADPVLAEALRRVAERERAASDLVNRLGKGARDALGDRLVERGLLVRQEDRVLGLFPRTRWLAADTAHEAEVRRALTAVLVQGLQPDARTGALVALLSSVDKAPSAVDLGGVPAREVRRRAKEVAEGSWAAKAVQDAVAAAMAAVMAGVTAATVATTTSS